MMTEERNYLCYLAGCGARKETAQPPDFAVDWSMFLKEAAALRLDSFVKYAIMKSPGLGCPEDTVSAIRGELLKKAAGIEKGSGVPQRDKVATITRAQLQEIAELKKPDLNAATIDTAISMIAGTARSMGVTVVDE